MLRTGLSSDTAPAHDPQLGQRLTILDSGETSAVTFDYDEYNNLIDQKEFDYGPVGSPGVAGQLLRETVMTYQVGSNYVDPAVHITNLLARRAVKDGSGNPVAYTVFSCDEYGDRPLQEDAGIGGHDAAYDTGHQSRANLTTVWQSLDGSNLSFVGAQYAYDIAGNVVWQNDANNHATTWREVAEKIGRLGYWEFEDYQPALS